MTADRWPKPLDKKAYHGVFGDIVTTIAPETEADPVAILLELLVMFGNCVGRTPHFKVGETAHHMNLFVAIVGRTSRGRKGTAHALAKHIFREVDEEWAHRCLASGLSSGEGLIWHVRDPIEKPRKDKGGVVDGEMVLEDAGVTDKRLVAVETEFASTLKVMMRDGSTLSPTCRHAWDGDDLRTLTKNFPATSTGPHISIIAQVTQPELLRYLEATETANGFGNRFLWALVQRSKELPEGGRRVSLDAFIRRLQTAVSAARRGPTQLRRAKGLEPFWAAAYHELLFEWPGMLGSMTARGEALVMRLACLYALADETHTVAKAHLQAALAVWKYCFDSVACLFGDRLGDPVADAILSELRRLAPESLTKTEIAGLFHRNKPASDINRALGVLAKFKLAKMDKDRSGDGRPIERWFYCGDEINESNERTPSGRPNRPAGPGDSSFTSSNSSPESDDDDDNAAAI
jgi:hypothetical protein